MAYPIFTERQKQFILSSIVERALLIQFWKDRGQDFEVDKISKVEGIMQWDAIIQSGGTKCLIEVKHRNITLKRYEKYGSKIDRKKFEFMINTCLGAQQEGEAMRPVYLVFYEDNKVALFYLDDIHGENQIKRYGNQSTQVKSNIVPKEELDIPFSNSLIYDFQMNRKNWKQDAVTVAEWMFPNNVFEWANRNNLPE